MCEIPAKREQRDPDISSENQESTFFSTDHFVVDGACTEPVQTEDGHCVSRRGAYKFCLRCGSILPKDTWCHVTLTNNLEGGEGEEQETKEAR